jgi:uncharacterized protein (TIGR02145 family)
MMWLAEKSAFRLGTVHNNDWDADSIGTWSTGIGYSTKAKGQFSLALGLQTTASGITATALGYNTTARGENAISMGSVTSALGDNSTSIGFKTYAGSYGSVALGRYNDTIVNSSRTAWVGTDPMLILGNGTSDASLHNTLVIYKNGNIISKNPTLVNVDPGTISIPVNGPGTRMMWIPEKSAFRIGTVDNANWNADSIGTWSTGIGFSTKAKGPFSLALGVQTTASGITSTALGYSTTASGENSVSMGSVTKATGPVATAMGYDTRSTGFASTAMGINTKSNANATTTMGSGTIAHGVQSTAMGFESRAMGNISNASGLNSIAKGYASTVIGLYNDSILLTNQTVIDPLTPLFVVGNGDGFGVGQRSNAMVVRKDGKVGIGTSNPDSKLHINGAVKIADGTQGAGKVLTSDAAGLASWQPPPTPPFVYYPTVSICCQSWMTKNLDVSTYRNGDAIPKVTNDAAWAALTTGAYCYYNNDSTTYAAIYGKMYNWYAVNDPRGLAPEGWHIPTDFEWTNLGNCLGGDLVAGGPMKEIGTSHWTTPNTGATNLSGFNGLPGGYRWPDGSFHDIGSYSIWWSSTDTDLDYPWVRYIVHNFDDLVRIDYEKPSGSYVRCVKD